MFNGQQQAGQGLPRGLFAGLPAEVMALALVLFAVSLRGIVSLGFLLYNYLILNAAGRAEMFFFSEARLSAVLALLAVICSIGLLRARPLARKATVALLLVSGWFHLTRILDYSGIGMGDPSYGVTALKFVWLIAQLASLALLYLLFIYILTRPHVRQAFGETVEEKPAPELSSSVAESADAGAASEDTGEEEAQPAAIDLNEAAFRVYSRLFGESTPLVIAVIAAFVIKDGVDDLAGNLHRSIMAISPPFAERFGYDPAFLNAGMTEHLLVFAAAVIGLLGIAAGAGIIRRASWARELTVIFLLISCVKWVLPVLLIKSGMVSTAFTHQWLALIQTAFSGLLLAIFYLALSTRFKQAQPGQPRKGVILS